MRPVRLTVSAVVLLQLSLAAAPFDARQHEHAIAATGQDRLGTVNFPTSCSAPAQPRFIRGLTLLHSFEFGAAISAFQSALRDDPDCAMAHWGIALSRWGNPFAARQRSAADLQPGLEEVTRARQAAHTTDRERAYIEAAARLFGEYTRVGQADREAAYADAMAKVAQKYPGDHEASIFYALALAASAPPSDKSYANQLKAGAILERLFREEPDHPGLAHYIIHAYDVPSLADHALDAARRYAAIAPDAPHALHMPSHTFTRLGYWQDSIDTNIRSAESAGRAHQVSEQLHAMDYLAYAYLQTGQDDAARRLAGSLDEVAAPAAHEVTGAAPPLARDFALAAIPARYTLERRAWREAAALTPRATTFPFAEAITWFARALGAAHTGDLAVAREAVSTLDIIRRRLVEAHELYWADQVAIQQTAARAWLAFAGGRREEGLGFMRDAATREDATEKNAVTPGPLAPARELLGDMLLDSGRPAEARAAYLATLQKEPNRFRAVYGAAHAAAVAGDAAAARASYARLVKICERGDTPGRPELQEARAALSAGK